ncbi:expressed unknown protein [Ectocarpus siliculosus]|uniref:Sulfotransferase n=1 Tax=Ectocarpus siliculosus TaxID=2880 RepID=D8LSQ3_ECTSI|nr:expressed unknown protein [Ectocarpus siliculosus]|eukprot:CBN75253.1 expressed unknown protein [Ectocarpus siliculosus]
MQQRRSLPPSSSTGRRGRQPQTPRSHPLCTWEVLGVATLLVLTIVNVCTYSERRAKFQLAHGGVLHTSDDDNGLPEHSLRPPAPQGKVSERTGGSEGGAGPDIYVASVGRPGGNVDASGTKRPDAVGGAVGGGDGRSGGGAGEETMVGSGGWKWTNKTTGPVRPLSPPTPPTPPTPSQPPTPLGRDAPLQVAVLRPANEAGGGSSGTGMNSWRWPSDVGAGSGGSIGGVSEAESAVGHFPCSLTEADDAPGPGHRGGGGGSNAAAARKQRLKPWSTSGPCVVSCSPPSSSSSTASGARQLVEARGPEDRIGGGGVAVTPIGGAPAGGGGGGGLERCERAARACNLYQECTHVMLPLGGGGGDGHSSGSGNRSGDKRNGGGFAVLMHRAARDGSMDGVEAAAAAAAAVSHAAGAGNGWSGPRGGFTLDAKPRTYYVVSFGGSGSKMLGGWLSERGKGMVKEVFHIHDPRPGDKLFAKVARRGVSAGGGGGRGKDFRGYDFPEGDFPSEGTAVHDVDNYRVVLIFKDPAEALVSRYFYNHCKNLRGARCGSTPADFPSLESYAEESGDRLHMEAFYDNYCNPATVAGAGAGASGAIKKERRNYPVVCVNYHKMWDNKEALVKALGLPAGEASKLPTRTETVRNDRTSAERGEPFTLAVRERLRRKHASLSKKVFESPAVAIV